MNLRVVNSGSSLLSSAYGRRCYYYTVVGLSITPVTTTASAIWSDRADSLRVLSGQPERDGRASARAYY